MTKKAFRFYVFFAVLFAYIKNNCYLCTRKIAKRVWGTASVMIEVDPVCDGRLSI